MVGASVLSCLDGKICAVQEPSIIIIMMSVFSLFMMVRGAKLPAYLSLEGFQHIGIFQLFEVKFESCVFWLAISFQMKVEGHHHQLVVTSSVYSWKTSCSGNVHS